MRTSPLSSSLEILESRIAPASIFADPSGGGSVSPNATAELIDGVLVVRPTNADAVMQMSVIQTGAGSFSVMSGGMGAGSFSDVTALRIAGGTANDTVSLQFLVMPGQHFGGGVRVNLGQGGEDAVQVETGRFFGDLSVKLGADGEFINTAFSRLLGNVQITALAGAVLARSSGSIGDVVLNGVQTVDFNGGEVRGDLLVRGRVDALLDVEAKPGVVFRGAVQIEHLGTQQSDVVFDTNAFEGPAAFLLGSGENTVSMSASILRDTLTVRGGANADTFTGTGTEIDGAVFLGLSGGVNSATFQNSSILHNALRLRGGSEGGKTSLKLDAVEASGGISMLAPLGDANLDFINSTVWKGVAVTNGAAKLDFSSDADTEVHGAIDVRGGTGDNTMQVLATATVRRVSYIGGSGVDVVTLNSAGENFTRATVNLLGGDDSMTLSGVDFFALALDGGAGDDAFFRSAQILSPLITTVRIEATTTI